MITQKRVVWGTILVGIGCLVAYVNDYRVKLYTGYCFEEKRYLTDEELQKSAIIFLIKHRAQDSYLSDDPVKSSYVSNPLLPDYESVEEFLKLNPNCCKPVLTKDPSRHNYTFWGDSGEGFEFSIPLFESDVLEYENSYMTSYQVGACGYARTGYDKHEKYNRGLRIKEGK